MRHERACEDCGNPTQNELINYVEGLDESTTICRDCYREREDYRNRAYSEMGCEG